MATVQMIRRRIKSAKGISQITKAMEMVAVTKLRRAQEATLRSRTYALGAREALVRLRRRTSAAVHPLFAQRRGGRRLAILFTNDRGLAGAYAANLVRVLLSLLEEADTRYLLQLIVIGQKGAQFAARFKDRIDMIGVYTGWPAVPDVAAVRPIVSSVTARFINKEVDRVSLIYTDFISTVRHSVVVRDLLPVDPATLLPAGAVLEHAREVVFEPSPQQVLDYIVPRLVEVQVYQAALEAAASEQAMRMLAMKNASDNAKELIDDLTLTYNGVRQAVITRELAEISAGAEALHS